MIELSRVGLVRGQAHLLSDVSLTFSAGTMVCITGPNGAGKSTLLKIAAGALTPTEGHVSFLGSALARLSGPARARHRAVVSQRQEIAFGFTSLEAVLLGRHPHHATADRKHDLSIARAALDRVDAMHLAQRDVTTLSGGEHQRVEIARALAQLDSQVSPEQTVLFLDEPTSNLDLAHQHGVLELARAASREGRLVVTVMHDLNLAAQYADRIVMLNKGKVAADGTPRDVLRSELIWDVFGLRVLILPHPELDCPLVVSSPRCLPAP